MYRAIGKHILAHPWRFLLAPLLLCLLLTPLATDAINRVTIIGWTPQHAESTRVANRLESEFGRATNGHYILFWDPSGTLRPADRAFRLDMEHALRPFRNNPNIASVVSWGSTGSESLNTALLSADGTKAMAIIIPRDDADASSTSIARLRGQLHTDHLAFEIGGWPAATDAFVSIAKSDLIRAESITLPITLLMLIVIFGGLLAAGIPIVLAGLSMLVSFAVISLVARFMTVNVFSINAITMLGLAVGIDYALIMVSRFREERRTRPLADAVPTTMETAGRSVVTAGSTVAIGLAGLLLFNVPASTSAGLSGALVVLICVALSLTALPAALVLLDERVAGGTSLTDRFRRSKVHAGSWLQRVRAHHPLVTIVACLAIVTLLSWPLTGISTSTPSMSELPSDAPAKQAYLTIVNEFPNATVSPINILVEPNSGSMMSSGNLTGLDTFVDQLSGLPGVESVESVFSYVPPVMSATSFATGLRLEPDLVTATKPFLTPNAALVNVVPDPKLDAAGQRDLVKALRSFAGLHAPGNLHVDVGGAAGLDLDLLDYIRQQIPTVFAFIILLTALALLVQLRSVFLPIKAILMNLCSIAASFGVMVWIFQEGHLTGLFRFTADGTTVVLIPVMMFCFLFGLSMDFEVIMLSRIRESWLASGNNTRAVDEGVEHTAGIVTASAALLLVIFLAFSTSDLVLVKAMGVGLSVAVLVDATIIRLLLLPATMQVMGRWNWWFPTRFTPVRNRS